MVGLQTIQGQGLVKDGETNLTCNLHIELACCAINQVANTIEVNSRLLGVIIIYVGFATRDVPPPPLQSNSIFFFQPGRLSWTFVLKLFGPVVCLVDNLQ